MVFWNSKKDNSLESNWYNDRSRELLSQRRILIYLNLFGIVAIVILVFITFKISQLRRFDPLVIKIEENTGQVLLVKPIDKSFLDSKENLARYFIKKYITTRESYNHVDFNDYAKSIIASLSSENIYSQYLGYIKSPENDPTKKYGDRNNTYVTIRSWSKLDNNKYIVRFSVTETLGNVDTFNKVAVIEMAYLDRYISDQESDINPVGFTVVGYKVSDDNS